MRVRSSLAAAVVTRIGGAASLHRVSVGEGSAVVAASLGEGGGAEGDEGFTTDSEHADAMRTKRRARADSDRMCSQYHCRDWSVPATARPLYDRSSSVVARGPSTSV